MTDALDILSHPLLLAPPRRVVEPLAWVGHIPFARLLVELTRPRVIVELGTHSGNSYNAFCEAVDTLGLPTRCYAVDTWAGDPQSGHYGAEVFVELSAYQEAHYRRFSTLLRMRFDEALERFEAGSVDLLHIDGLHTYEAVRHDFESWQPKLSNRGVVLFHDIAVRRDGFGVWRLWDELKSGHPHLEFQHCNGLGLLATGTNVPEGVRQLLDLDELMRQQFVLLMEQLGGCLTHGRETQALQQDMQSQRQQNHELAATVEKLQQEMATLVRELLQMQQQRAASVARLDSMTELTTRLAAREEEVAQLGAVIDDLRRSNSWRLTAPLRWLSRQRARIARLWQGPRAGDTRSGK